MTRGEVADRAGVNRETVRYYEQRGLIPEPPRTDGDYRVYTNDYVRRIQFIKHAQGVGFTLREIAELLSLRAQPDGSCEEVLQYTEEKIAELETKMEQLQSMKRALENLAAMCPSGLPVTACPILEALDDNQSY